MSGSGKLIGEGPDKVSGRLKFRGPLQQRSAMSGGSVPDTFSFSLLVRCPELEEVQKLVCQGVHLLGAGSDECAESQRHDAPGRASMFFERFILVDTDQDTPEIGQDQPVTVSHDSEGSCGCSPTWSLCFSGP